uniref:Serpentine receptor class gamma n=1 Tax=Panagrolaimus davidi TaxID=227884 RepID=A0A914QE11_9BILA
MITKSDGQHLTFYIRFGCISLNVVSAVVLFLIIKVSLNANNSAVKRMNNTVLVMVGCTTILEFIPLLTAQIFFWITANQIQKYIGPYAVTGTTIILALSMAFYYKVFKKSSSNNNSGGVVKIFNTHSAYITTTTANTRGVSVLKVQ